MAVSGLHVSIAAALLMLLLKKLRIGKLASFAALNVFLGLMIIMVKSPVSAVRAAIMLDFMYSARLFRRQNDTFNSLSGAVLIICLLNPYAVQDSGFLLSIAGTFGVGAFAPFMTSGMKSGNIFQRLVKSVAAMLSVTLMVMPLSILYFDETSVIYLITNIVLIPLTIAAMIIGFIYVITGGIISLLFVAEILTDIVLAAADKLGIMQFTHFSCGNKKLFLISLLCAAFVIFAAAVIKNKRYISLAVVGALTVFVFSSAVMSRIEQNKFKVAVLGRGSNVAVVISYNGSADIIDLSGHYKSLEYVRRYLTMNGTENVRTLFLTSKAPSQYAAYLANLELFDIDRIMSSSTLGLSDDVDDIIYFNDTSVELKNKDYYVNYADGALEITYSGITVLIEKAGSESSGSADIFVYYGNITEKTALNANEGCIYLDAAESEADVNSDMNNFEIIFSSDSGGAEIRRL